VKESLIVQPKEFNRTNLISSLNCFSHSVCGGMGGPQTKCAQSYWYTSAHTVSVPVTDSL